MIVDKSWDPAPCVLVGSGFMTMQWSDPDLISTSRFNPASRIGTFLAVFNDQRDNKSTKMSIILNCMVERKIRLDPGFFRGSDPTERNIQKRLNCAFQAYVFSIPAVCSYS